MINTEILEQYPKAAERYYAFAGRVLNNIQNMAKEGLETDSFVLPDVTQDQVEEYAKALLTMQQRDLYTFFDQEELFITVGYNQLNSQFYFGLYDKAIMGKFSGDTFPSREEAELVGFKDAFRVLQTKLENEAV